MYKENYWRKLITVLFITLPFVFTGCQGMSIMIGNGPHPEDSSVYRETGPPPWAPAHGYRAKYRYRYYPASRVYYEERSGVYFHYREGQWRMSASLPIEIRIDVNNFVSLEMNTNRPYEYHHEVVKRYPPGQLKKKGMTKGKGKGKWK
jgi:hypothetical protein